VLDSLAARECWRGRECLVDPPPRLDRGLLVGRDDAIAGVKQPALPASFVQIEDPAGLLREVRVGGEDPGALLPGADRVLSQPTHDR
jgi:hypothetical protein